MPRSIFRAVLTAFWMWAALCAAQPANLWLNVPFVQQTKDGCGAASIAMVMQYWERQQGLPASPNAASARILHALYSSSAHGIYASAMERYFERNGYRTFAFAGEWADFQRELAKGRPLIVAIKPRSSHSLHYVVVAGLDQPDQKDQLVLLNDSARRKLLKEDKSSFEKEWKATGYWTLLAVPETSSH